MKDQIQAAIEKVGNDQKLIETMRQSRNVKERLDRLMEFLPETLLWDPMSARRLVFFLQKSYSIDFGVCSFYEIDPEEDKQYCTIDGEKVECLCAIPEAYCVIRDKDGQPKYSEFSFIRVLESMED